MRFLLFFIAEFATAGAFAAIAATLFLGGWYLPGRRRLDANYMNVLGPLILFAKIMLVGVPDLLVPLHLSPLPGGPAAAFAWKYLIPLVAREHRVTAILKVVF